MIGRDPHEFYDRFGAVMRRLRATAAHAYSEFELGTAQAKLLRHIGEKSPISQADLARATDTAPTLTGRALDPLVERGWVKKRRSELDRREYVLELTAAGRRARARVVAVREEIIERIGAVLDDKDMKDFDRIAAKILVALQDGSEMGGKR